MKFYINDIKNDIKNFCRNNIWIILLCCAVFLIGTICGVNKTFQLDDIEDALTTNKSVMFLYITNKSSFFSFFICMILYQSLIYFIFLIAAYNNFTCYLSYIMLFILPFICFYHLSLFIGYFLLKGLIFSIFYILFLTIIFLINNIIFLIILSSKYRYCYGIKECINLVSDCFWWFISGYVIIFIFAVLFAIIKISL